MDMQKRRHEKGAVSWITGADMWQPGTAALPEIGQASWDCTRKE